MSARFLSLSIAAVLVAAASAQQSGITVRYYELDQDVSLVPDLVPGQSPSEVVGVTTIDLKDGGAGYLKERFLTEIDAILNVETAGEHAFRLICDDGGLLWIGGSMVVNNDGLHGAVPKDGSVKLDAGKHALRIRHFQGGGGWALRLEWKLPGASEFALVPTGALSSEPVAYKVEKGKKRIVPPLRRGKPGDGSPTSATHPGYQTPAKAPPAPKTPSAFIVDGWLKQGDTTVAWTNGVTTKGPIRAFVDGALRGQLLVERSDEIVRVALADGNASVHRFQSGLATSFVATDKVAFEVSRATAKSNGVELEFTQPLDPRCGWEADAYYVEQWPFDGKGGAPARDGSTIAVKSASVSADRKRVFLEIPGLKASHVVYLRVLPPCISAGGDALWSTESWLTLNQMPADQVGAVTKRPETPPQNLLSDAEKAEGWKLLFDGKSLAGWRGFKKPEVAGWSVVDGCLVRTGPGGDIMTADQYQDYEFKLEWRISPAGNSGIIYRVSNEPPNNYPWETGPEMQVLDNSEHADGRNALTSAGSDYALLAPPKDVTRPIGFFNEARIVVQGNHVEHWLNGEKQCEYELNSPEWNKLVAGSKFKDMPRYGTAPRGYIVLQDHGDRVWYRNIKIRELK